MTEPSVGELVDHLVHVKECEPDAPHAGMLSSSELAVAERGPAPSGRMVAGERGRA